jgi:ParB family chromosome partitioning protein
MSTKRRGLGRNLEALLGGSVPSAPLAPSATGTPAAKAAPTEAAQDGELRVLPTALLQPGKYQPRKDMDPAALAELADSIKSQGVIQPVVVRPVAGGRYEIIAGERRWRAAQQVGLADIPTVVRRVSDQAAIAMALIENIQREDLNPLEEAAALSRLIAEFKLTHEEAAEAVGRSRAAVSNLLRLMDLHPEAKALVEKGIIEMGHARAILGLPFGRQAEAARRVASEHLTVRDTEELVRRLQNPTGGLTGGGKTPTGKTPGAKDANIRALEEELAERLQTKVEFQHAKSGKGRLVIHYHDLESLDGILDRLR